MDSIQTRIETWIRDQGAKFLQVSWGPLQWRKKWQWPPWNTNDREQRQKLQQEYERRKHQLHELCLAVKADSIADLQDILCCMVLSECVYKRPAAEMVRAVNKFKVDFGGQIVSLDRVQPSSDHVPHRYLLAEAGDTLLASFIGTKQYKDIMADANILQGAIFHEDAAEDIDRVNITESNPAGNQKGIGENHVNSPELKSRQLKDRPKPAAHRGFLARAKGIPALELYRLAQKKKRKLVLCGHSLGGAVAALATLAILRVIAVSSSKEQEKVHVKCITFSQPPVGNAALRDYVNNKGWQQYFKSYCIPEDLVPRILSPAYFHHYNSQTSSSPPEVSNDISSTSKIDRGVVEKGKIENLKENEEEQLVMGVGPVQGPFWRLSRLVPLEGVRRQLDKYRGRHVGSPKTTSTDSMGTSSMEHIAVRPQSLEIQEGADGISLKPFSENDNGPSDVATEKLADKSGINDGHNRRWNRLPYLPSYVPFGELYILGNSSVDLLSGAEYSKLTSVRSVIAELREMFQSHSMKSYRSRFQRIFDLCMNDGASSFLGMEQLQQFPHLQQWLGLAVAGTVELGHIVESPVIHAATSLVPLGWNGIPSDKNAEPLKVDITGFGLHLCTLVHAQINGRWCSTTVESFPSAPTYSLNHGEPPELQKIRVLVGAPLGQPPKHQSIADSLMSVFPTIDSENVNLSGENIFGSHLKSFLCPDSLSNFFIFCTSDFSTISKEVHVRTRRVRLLGFEGAGKTSLFKAILGQGKFTALSDIDNLHLDIQEGIAGGLCYSDSQGVNLQELTAEASHFRDELWKGIRDLSRKTDLVVLVHNLSHKIPQYNDSDLSQQYPALSLLLREAKALGIPWILAITNKFSVSAHQQKAAIAAVVQAYQASPSTTGVVNSCPYVIPSPASASLTWSVIGEESNWSLGVQKFLAAPINLVRRPFQRKETIFPVEGINSLCQLVNRVLRSQEEASLEELARDRLAVELAREQAMTLDRFRDSQAKVSAKTAAAVGASLGAGLGIVLAMVMGAASALRKP